MYLLNGYTGRSRSTWPALLARKRSLCTMLYKTSCLAQTFLCQIFHIFLTNFRSRTPRCTQYMKFNNVVWNDFINLILISKRIFYDKKIIWCLSKKYKWFDFRILIHIINNPRNYLNLYILRNQCFFMYWFHVNSKIG